MKNQIQIFAIILLGLMGSQAWSQDENAEKIERIDVEAIRGLFEMSAGGRSIYGGLLTGFPSQGQLVCATGSDLPDGQQAETTLKILGAPKAHTTNKLASTSKVREGCGSRFGYGAVGDVSRAFFSDVLGMSMSNVDTFEFKSYEQATGLTCEKGHLLEIGDQGLWPVATFLRSSELTFAGSKALEETGCNSNGNARRVGKVDSYLEQYLVSSGDQIIPKINSTGHSRVLTEIKFLRLLQGGSQFKMQLTMNGFSTVPLENSKLVSDAKGVTWEGNFRLVDCTDSEGLREAERSADKISSLEQVIQRRNEMELPGYKTCTFIAPKMTTKVVGQWNERIKVIVPTLRDVVLEVNASNANIRFASYSGIPFQGRQILSKNSPQDIALVSSVVTKAEKLLEIMNGSLDQVWEDHRSSNTLIPKTVAYFNLRKDLIQSLVTSLDADLKQGGLPFMAALEIMITMKKAWAFIDRSVGMATRGEMTLQNVIPLPQTSVTGNYFSERGAALAQPIVIPTREVPVYNVKKQPSNGWSFGSSPPANSNRSNNTEGP